jgi:hypothetical protein
VLNTAADPNIAPPSGLYVINADGTALTQLIDTGDHVDGPWWVPDIRQAGDATEPATTESNAASDTGDEEETSDSGG